MVLVYHNFGFLYFVIFIMKTCSRCKLDKELTDFAINKNKKCGLQSYCKLCQKEIRENKIYETNNSDYHKKYYTANKDVLLKKTKRI